MCCFKTASSVHLRCSLIEIFLVELTGIGNFREEADSGDCETRDSFSDSCSEESESEKLSRMDGCSSEDSGFEQDALWHLNDRLGYLYFQYFERSAPYARVPLMDKVTSLPHACLNEAYSFSFWMSLFEPKYM